MRIETTSVYVEGNEIVDSERRISDSLGRRGTAKSGLVSRPRTCARVTRHPWMETFHLHLRPALTFLSVSALQNDLRVILQTTSL